jgi:ATP-dependent Clp protease ATP-binding subunit ClpB
MRTDKLTVKNHEILEGALGLASQKGNPQIEPIHILAVMLQVSEEIARPVLGKIGDQPARPGPRRWNRKSASCPR